MGRFFWAALAFSFASFSLATDGFVGAESVGADFTQVDTSAFRLENSEILSKTNGVAKVRFLGKFAQMGQVFSTARNWSAYPLARMTLQNFEARTVRIKFIVQVKPNLDDYSGSWDGEVVLGANERKTIVFQLNPTDASPYGMKALPPILDAPFEYVRDGSATRSFKTVYHWRLSLQDSTAATVSAEDFTLMSWDTDFTGISDQWGQYTRRFWTDRIVSETDFANQKSAETTYLNFNPPNPEIWGTGRFGGAATGKWRVMANSNGRWYFVTPEGKHFWSMGVSAIHDDQYTPVEGRLNYFMNLPSETGPNGVFYAYKPTSSGTKKSYNFMRQNLAIKYGTDFMPAWLSRIKKRLPAWGFNTVGMQSDPGLYDGSIPYTVIVHTKDFPTKLSTPWVHWNKLPDVFDPSFQSWIENRFEFEVASHNGNPGFMGVYVDNELSWGDESSTTKRWNVALGALKSGSTQPAKQAFVRHLSKRYRYIARLNQAWGSSFDSWLDLLSTTTYAPTQPSVAMQGDLRAFQRLYAVNYYGRVKLALDNIGCTGLYLGSRFSSYTPEAIESASFYADVLSFNYYRFAADMPWSFLNSLSKPVMISEWCVTAMDKGSFGGAPEVSSYAARASTIRNWLNAAIQQRNVVGAHWYSYADQPITGRWSDGENMGRGLIDIADTPHYETVEVFREISGQLYSMRN